MAKVAINGLGRIGRATLKIVMNTPGLELVAANDLGGADNIVYLLKYDTVYGRYEKTVEATDEYLTIGAHRVTLLRETRSGAPALEVVERGHRVRVHRRFHTAGRPRCSYSRRSPVRHPLVTVEE
jgi:glyceraldehyde-3-phosphate dehydrogenase/erythrose-4-phosphate dehydrogenase